MTSIQRRLGALMLAAAATLLCGGCHGTFGPKMPDSLTAAGKTGYKSAEFTGDVADYRDLVKKGDLQGAEAKRNQIAYRVMSDIEMNYSKFETNLTTQRAGAQTAADAVQLGISAAATVVGDTDVKDLLTASLGAFQGTRLSADKNFFREKTTESILSQMRASRDSKKADLIAGLGNRDVTQYPWDAVWMDLVNLYYAGTVPSALVEIASTSGAKAETASTNLKIAVQTLPTRTVAQAAQAMDVRTAYTKLKAAIDSNDTAKTATAVSALKSILTAAGYPPADGASAEALLAQLQLAMHNAATDSSGDKLQQLNAAVAQAKVQ